ncbi:hypothetical protein MRX96_057356 [Rhipicephalus microplus]
MLPLLPPEKGHLVPPISTRAEMAARDSNSNGRQTDSQSEDLLWTQRRHVDQLRARLTSSTPEKNPSVTGISPTETQPAPDAREASPATPESPVSTRATRALEAVPYLLQSFNANTTTS